MSTNSIERIGVSKCSFLFEKNKFIFREQPISDYGIDALIETREKDNPTGKMIAVQIKSGESYFKETDGEYIIYRVDEKHRNYWINHSLPVIIVLYSPMLDKCIWENVNKQTLTLCGRQWKIRIPKDKTIEENGTDLYEIAKNISEYEHRHASLVFAKEWMIEARKQGSLILEVEEWINKSSGRGTFILKTLGETGEERILFERGILGFGLKSYDEVIQELFPWADVRIDKDFYEDNYEMDDTQNWDLYDEYSEIFYSPKQDGIYPYRNGAGEVDFYRLLLTLNDIGNAFLITEDFLENGKFYCIDHFEKQ